MSMYLSNSDLWPTGAEVAEFLDVPPMAEAPGAGDGRGERPDGPAGGATGPDLRDGA
jgi:hypothetical protein